MTKYEDVRQTRKFDQYEEKKVDNGRPTVSQLLESR